ncbi:VOC family protein [Eubacteriales bacterium OttesenSCG-928-N14]|nr:VOC family protein [Eubacteriales bacterium OttesenSCG-928-N14]
MSIDGVHHLAIVVKDLDDTMKFWHEMLGFEVTRVVDTEGFYSTYLMIPGFGELELTVRRGKLTVLDIDGTETGLDHFALLVDDPMPYYELVKQHGYQIDVPPTDMDPYGHCACIVRDPNGVMMEFLTPYGYKGYQPTGRGE